MGGFPKLTHFRILFNFFLFCMSLTVRSCTFPGHDLFIALNRLSNLVFHLSYSHLGLEVCMKNVLGPLKSYLKEKLNYSLSRPDLLTVFTFLDPKDPGSLSCLM